ncbi:hypothetical protein L1987_15302 [Smallanthus sonchifolius]|uniref:Uncharacterized protein n=1 Tax=Smallanthus sonchifolius TaxID=185202 RepID=A0ACB9J5P8_9ASTR|nr:hypothetical protein L1987_15302 [Smallanthus sonchifolius]
MGGICGKPHAIDDDGGRGSWRVSRSKRLESFRVKNRGEVRSGSTDKRLNSSRRVRDDQYEKERAVSQVFIAANIPKALEGQQVVAGWPSWLAAVAGEAVNGWLPRRADSFQKLDKIGQGTYSSVCKARDLTNDKVVALKRVRFDNMDPESVKFMAREILILRRLDHQNIIKLEGLVTSRTSCTLYLVFEYMEHDLKGIASLPGVKFTEPQVEQLHKIFKLCRSPSEDYWRKSNLRHLTLFKPTQPYRRRIEETFKDVPSVAISLMESLLAIDPSQRGTASSALKSEFFTTKPHACDPSSVPKYPPSKEIDAKLREEEARRLSELGSSTRKSEDGDDKYMNSSQSGYDSSKYLSTIEAFNVSSKYDSSQDRAGGKGQKIDNESRGSREHRAVPALEANAELVALMQL